MIEYILARIYAMLYNKIKNEHGPVEAAKMCDVQHTIDGEHMYRVRPSFGAVVTKNDTYRIRSNKIMVQNAGNCIVKLFNFWTLYPGGSVVLGCENDWAKVEGDMEISFDSVQFDPSKTLNPLVQILKMDTIHPQTTWNGISSQTNIPS